MSLAESQSFRHSQNTRFVYTSEEREVLRALVRKYSCVLENKRTNSASVASKNKAWEKLCLEYCSQPNIRPRNAKQLRKLWDNEKSRWKKAESQEKRDLYATGGGPHTCRPMSPSLDLVGAVASHMSEGVINPYDSDGAHRGEPVLSLPPATIFNAMVDPDTDFTDMPGTSCCDRTPPSVVPVSPPQGPGTPPAASVGTTGTTGTSAATGAQESRAGGRIAAVKSVLAAEAEARIRSLEDAERRERQLHTLRKKLQREKLMMQTRRLQHEDLNNKMELEHKEIKNKLEIELLEQKKKIKNKLKIELLEMEINIKQQQLASLASDL